VLETRIRSAISLMESGNSSISEIAALTGFSDTNYFTRYFKQIIGTTPGKYIQTCIQK
jgi:YesN/AraC family two-component response regulator